MTTTPPLAARLGVVVPDGLPEELAATLADNVQIARDTLVATGEIDADALASGVDPRRAAIVLPRSVADVLAVAVADARARGDAAHEAALSLHYLDALPRARLVQLLCDRAPHRWLFHAPVPWERLPRFVAGLERLFTLFAEHGLDPAPIGARDAASFLAARPTLADLYVDTYYGSLLPMFGATEHDLARLERDVRAAPERRWALVDRRLSNALLHELLHFRPEREAVFPPYLDEAIAAHFGLTLDERVAFPREHDDGALVGWPWFSQVGAALARVVGDGPLLAAQAGLRAWSEVLPTALRERVERDAWQAYRERPAVHFHPDTTRPDRWVRLMYELAPPTPDPARDMCMLVHALTAMCLHAEQRDGSWHITRRAPDGPVTVDFAAGVVRAPPRASGWEPAPLLHALPPSLIGSRRSPVVVTLDPRPAALEAIAVALASGPALGESWTRGGR